MIKEKMLHHLPGFMAQALFNLLLLVSGGGAKRLRTACEKCDTIADLPAVLALLGPIQVQFVLEREPLKQYSRANTPTITKCHWFWPLAKQPDRIGLIESFSI